MLMRLENMMVSLLFGCLHVSTYICSTSHFYTLAAVQRLNATAPQSNVARSAPSASNLQPWPALGTWEWSQRPVPLEDATLWWAQVSGQICVDVGVVLFTYIYIYIYVFIHIYICIYVCIYLFTILIFKFTYIYIYMYTHFNVHTHIHTYIHTACIHTHVVTYNYR